MKAGGLGAGLRRVGQMCSSQQASSLAHLRRAGGWLELRALGDEQSVQGRGGLSGQARQLQPLPWVIPPELVLSQAGGKGS